MFEVLEVSALFLGAKLAVGSRVYNSFFDGMMLKVLNCPWVKTVPIPNITLSIQFELYSAQKSC